MIKTIFSEFITDENISDLIFILFINFVVVFAISAVNILISQIITSFSVKSATVCFLYLNNIITVVKASSLSHIHESDFMIKLWFLLIKHSVLLYNRHKFKNNKSINFKTALVMSCEKTVTESCIYCVKEYKLFTVCVIYFNTLSRFCLNCYY